MGVPRTIGLVAAPATAGWRTPVYSGPVLVAVSFSILNGIATIKLGSGALPKNGYCGPNGYPTVNATTGSKFDIHGGVAPGISGMGNQVTLWGWTTATYFNGCTITVLDCDPQQDTFRFYFNHANVNSTADTGNTASAPSEHYRAVRLEVSQSNSTNVVYVGDLNVSATQYMAALTLAGQMAIVIESCNIPADRIFIFGSSATDCGVQVSLIY